MPVGLSPQLEEALETFAAEKKARQKKVDELTAKAEAGGVKGMAARQELRILESETRPRRTNWNSPWPPRKGRPRRRVVPEAVKNLKEEKEKAAKADADARRAKMKARAAMFDKGGAVAPRRKLRW